MLQKIDDWLKSKRRTAIVHTIGSDGEADSMDILGLVDIDAIHLVIYISLATAGSFVVDATFVVGHATEAQTDVVEMNVLDFTLFSTDEAAVLRRGDNTTEVDAAHLTAASVSLTLGETPVGILVVAVGTRVTGDIDRFGFAPPHVALQVQIHDDVGKNHVCHRALIAVLNAQSTVGTCDDAVVDDDIIDGVHVL